MNLYSALANTSVLCLQLYLHITYSYIRPLTFYLCIHLFIVYCSHKVASGYKHNQL